MRTYGVSVLETVSGLDLTVSCQTFAPDSGPMPIGGHSYTRVIPWSETDDSWDDVLRTIAEELFNLAHYHEHC